MLFLKLGMTGTYTCGNIGIDFSGTFPYLVSTAITIIKIAVPILLIIFGMLDLGKAVIASKEDEIKKGQQTFIKRAITAKCVNAGYTGCHIYKITATSTQTLENASLNLTLTQSGAADKGSWKYVTFTDTADNGSAAALVDGKSGSFDVATPGVDLHSGAKITGGTPVVYYLMIYLENKNAAQNETGNDLATGSYTGTVTFQAAGGRVSATFSA